MEWPDDLAGALPAPREDEPPELRRKIVAELRDHLQTAVQRELLATGDAEKARHNVLVRFGDPARVARNLWFDALWEKIMTQRWILAALVVMVLVSVASAGLTCFLVVQAGQMNQALLEQSRAANETLLAKLASLGSQPASAEKSMDWNSLKVRFSYEKPDGAPVAGVLVSLEGRLLDSSVPTSLTRTTGPDGIADFGLVRPGQHLLNVVTPWGETIEDANFMSFNGSVVTVLPGEPQTHEIVCPSEPEESEISFAVEWPEELSGRPLWLVCDLVKSPRVVGGHAWEPSENEPQFLVVDPSGLVTNPAMRVPDEDRVQSGTFFRGEGMFQYEEYRLYVRESKSFVDVPGIYRFTGNQSRSTPYPVDESRLPPFIWIPKSAAVSRLKWPAGGYSVRNIAVGCDSEMADASLPDDLIHPEFLGGIDLTVDNKGRSDLLYPDEKQARSSRRKRKEPKTETPRFEAVPGRLNEWRLSIPERLVELLTERQAEGEANSTPDENDSP